MTNLELLKTLIQFKISTRENINKAMDFLAKYLAEGNIQLQVLENSGYKIITAETGSGDKTIILNGHVDVVSAEDSQFTPVEHEGNLFGSGTYDMLGGVAVFVNLFKELSASSLNVKVRLMLVPTEETCGEIGTLFLLDKGFSGDFAICGEPTNLNVSKKSKGALQLKIKVKGKSCHGSTPWKGENPIEKAVELYNKVKLSDFLKIEDSDFGGPSTVSLNSIETDPTINKVSEEAVIGLDIRTVAGVSFENAIDEITAVFGRENIETLNKICCVQTEEDDPFLNKLLECAKSFNPGSSTTVMRGAADTRFFYEKGIPSVEFGPVGFGHHGQNEYVDIKSLGVCENIVRTFLESF